MNKIFPPDSVLASEYKGGRNIAQIASAHGISTGYVCNRLRACGVERRPRGLPFGFHHTDQAKLKISAAKKGVVRPAEWCRNISLAKRCNYNGLNGYGHTKSHCRGYMLAYVPMHPHAHSDGYVMLHTVLVERKIGRYLYESEVVHHLNHVRDDNRLENLVLMDKKQHMSMHMKQRYAERKANKLCNAFL